MAKEKYLITSNCRLSPQHAFGDRNILGKGETLELDPKNKRDAEVRDLLILAGRLCTHTPANEKFLKDELKREQAEIDRIVAERTKSMNADESLVRRLVGLLRGGQPSAA